MWENIGNMMEMVKKLQQSVDDLQDQLKNERITVTSSDIITLSVNGHQEIISLEISPKYLTPENAALLQSLLVSTINNGLAKSKELNQQAMSKLTGDLNLPKIPGLF